MMTEAKMWDVIKNSILETGKLPKNKTFVVGEFKYDFYRVTKTFDNRKTVVVMADDDFLDRVDNKFYGRPFYKVYYKQSFGENFKFTTKSYTTVSL
jgi:hypothetical protein